MSAEKLKSRHILGIYHLDRDEINLILDTAERMKEISRRRIKKVPALRGVMVVNLFYEASTRTRLSFETAEKRLSADSLNFSKSTSSAVKGETLKDTVLNIEAMDPDITVIRHISPGVPQMLTKLCKGSVINAGDGGHEHPTQALLDALTIRDNKGRIEGLKVSLIGDIKHSRVARSNILLLNKMGAEVTVCGPRTMMPPGIETLGVRVEYKIEDALRNADVVMMLRVQLERQSAKLFPTTREYFKLYGLTAERLRLAKKDVIVMHPGPMNRGVEIDSDVADGPFSVILDQVSNGVAVRMALLYLLFGGSENELAD